MDTPIGSMTIQDKEIEGTIMCRKQIGLETSLPNP